MSKYTFVAYLLWLFLGYFGVHHFYLGRDKQGILWLTSFGGIFCLGWVRDFYRIPTYVKEANNDPYHSAQVGLEMRFSNRGPSMWKYCYRIVGQVLFGYLYRSLIRMAIPEEFYEFHWSIALIIPFGSALGTYMVSNVGRIKSPLKYSLIGAYIGELLFGELHFLSSQKLSSFAVGVSMLFSTYGWQWDRAVRQKGSCCQRFKLWFLAFILFSTLCGSYVYFNMSVVTKDGETLKVREVVHNFFLSPHWTRLKASLWKVYDDYQQGGWEGAKQRLTIMADFEGEERFRTVLGVAYNATKQEVKERYRELAKLWHPDKHRGTQEEREYANEKFMEIKEAYENLDKIYTRREERWGKFKRSR